MKQRLFFIILCAAVLCGCQKEDTSMEIAKGIDASAMASNIYLTKAQTEITKSVNDFAFNLFDQVRAARLNPSSSNASSSFKQGGSILLSPFSASMALSMAAIGAGGETERQMLSVLGLEGATKTEVAEYCSKMISGLGKADPYVDLKIANSMWINKEFAIKDDYVGRVEKAFDAVVASREFNDATLKEINSWVEKKTDGTIKELLDQFSPDAMVELINALAFDGKWRYAFAGTKKGSFSAANGKKQKVDMMYATGVLGYATQDGWEMLELPYGAGGFLMDVILPPAGAVFDAAELDASRWDALRRKMHPCEVNMKIPSFKLLDSHDLIGPLEALGMREAFGPYADFSGISDDKTHITKVDQKTFIEVNETGTKATAATVVEVAKATSSGLEGMDVELEAVNFDADRAFYYVISERSTGAVLFIGQAASF
jgi:serpin B